MAVAWLVIRELDPWLPAALPARPHAIQGRLNWYFAHSGVAQLAARMILVHEVGGSSPPPRALTASFG